MGLQGIAGCPWSIPGVLHGASVGFRRSRERSRSVSRDSRGVPWGVRGFQGSRGLQGRFIGLHGVSEAFQGISRAFQMCFKESQWVSWEFQGVLMGFRGVPSRFPGYSLGINGNPDNLKP